MATAVYVEDGDCCKYFVCFAPDENKTIDVAETVVEREAFKNADGVEYVSFEKCETVKQFAFEDCRELKAVVWGKASKNTQMKKVLLVFLFLRLQTSQFKARRSRIAQNCKQ